MGMNSQSLYLTENM